MFLFYWTYIGLPYSIISGFISDSIPFNLTEVFLWLSFFSFFFGIYRKKKKFWITSLLYPVLMGLSQGATTMEIAPTSNREAIFSVTDSVFTQELALETYQNTQNRFLLDFDSAAYFNYDYSNLEHFQNAIYKAFDTLGVVRGRKVTALKDMWGVSLIIGLAYGGPGFHDIITSEIALAPPSQYITPLSWRIKGHVHEMVHTQGFGNEFDTELITWLAMKLSKDKVLEVLADQMVLQKAPMPYEIPNALFTERLETSHKQKLLRKSQRLISFLESLSNKTGIRNSHKKYGKGHTTLEKNRFLKTIYFWQRKYLNG